MKNASSRFGLPLLTRELIELAARKRTYFIRVAYATVLFLIVLVQSADLMQMTQQAGLQSLGSGATVFGRLFSWQLLGVFIIMPIITCSAIAHEKERDTLQLLLVTHLGPVTILLEKLLSRVLVMISMLVMSLPMMAYAFSLGGITEGQILGGMIILITTTIYVGTFTLMCSSLCSSTVSAFICTIALGLPFMGITSSCVLSMLTRGWDASAFVGTAISQLCFSVLFFVISLAFLVERAMQPPRNVILQMFRRLDRFFTELNERTTGGVVLVRDKNTLPHDEPIVWRETHKKSLGTFRYLVRILVVIELPTILILLHNNYQFSEDRGVALVMVLWGISMLMVTARVASIVSGERSRQTLDVLLTTPMTSQQIIRQHIQGTRRLKWVLQLPLLTVLCFRIYWNPFDERLAVYAIGTLFALFVFFELCSWLSMLIGLAVRSQMKALLLSTAVVFGLALGPVLLSKGEVLHWSVRESNVNRQIAAGTLCVVTPTNLLYQLETGRATPGLLCAHWIFYGLLLWGVRTICFRGADHWLGRCDTREVDMTHKAEVAHEAAS